MPTPRETRYEKLIGWGFVKAEATAYSRVDFESPKSGIYWQEMCIRRERQYRDYLNRGGTREGWVVAVKEFYRRKGWFATHVVKGR
jgi:hypothetical protein